MIQDMQTAVHHSLKQIPLQEFHDTMNMLPMRWMKCVKVEGDYFDGKHIAVDPRDFGLELAEGPDTEESSDSEDNE